MKKYAILLFVALLLGACSTTKKTFKQEEISLLPKPVSFQLKENSFEFTSSTKVVLQDESQQKAVNYLLGLFRTAAGYDLKVISSKKSNTVIFEKVTGLKKGAYTVDINAKSILITASEETGYFNAVQTIRQLLPNQIESKKITKMQWLVPAATIADEPKFEWRGMHMDFSRHFFNIDEVKSFLDNMALYKLNTYHMHLTDDQGWRIEIKKYPLLTEEGAWRIPNNQDTICNTRAVENKLYTIDESNFKEVNGQRKYGGFFTQDQIKEIVAYADDRCITVIPEIDMPGHFKSAIDNYPFLSCNGESGWDTVFTYPTCLGKDTTYEFMKNVLSEVVELFPANYIHIGGDEVNIKSWEKCPHCQKAIKDHGLKDEHELQSYFNRDIEQFLLSKGKRFMGWDEIVKGGLTKDASIMWWRNWAPEAPKTAAKNGNDIVITTTAAYYFDYLNEGNKLENVYKYEPVPADFTEEEAGHVLGIQANLWSETIPNFKRLQYQAYPRMFAVAENAWVSQEKDFASFNKRVEKQYDRLDALDVYYYIPAVEGLDKEIAFVDKTEVNLNLAYPLEGTEIYYTLDGTVPTKSSLHYETPFTVNDTVEIKAKSYRGSIYNDLKTTKVIRKEYKAAAVDPSTKANGLKQWFIKGQFKTVEDITSPTATNYKSVDSIALGNFKDQKDFAIVYQGFFNAEKDGIYEFETRSDGGNLLFIDDDLIVDNGGYHGPRKKYGKVALKKGLHPIKVNYKASENPKMIDVWYALQGEVLKPLNSSVTKF
ncbi:family 20 glycosylhydrolase [Flavobacterium algicola]|uniref:family 20 glycosylhydrolase n=1 Tax=Flavobacterium algicola TaxID=556529 RepID=UPI001EFEE008|nr:family 20 glycosylhydrolase [Flavobacterium algicola]MCG9793151.1 family 20 glycosylhydrolase [Flavobacterium algicola]